MLFYTMLTGSLQLHGVDAGDRRNSAFPGVHLTFIIPQPKG